MATKKTTPSWSDVKAKLADFDRTGLIGLVQALYAASKDNQTFLHTRFGLGEDLLKPYKAIIERWIAPDVYRSQTYSVAKAKKPIADYKKAIGRPEELAELMLFYCEGAAGFSAEYGMDDEGYYDALLRMFENALKVIATLPEPTCGEFLDRLDRVRRTCRDFGYGVYDDMTYLLGKYGIAG